MEYSGGGYGGRFSTDSLSPRTCSARQRLALSRPVITVPAASLYTPGDGDPHTIFLKFPSPRQLAVRLEGGMKGQALSSAFSGGTFCSDGWWASLLGSWLTAWSLSSRFFRGVETVSSNLRFHFAAVGEEMISAVTDLLNRITYSFLFSRSCNTLETNSFIKSSLYLKYL